MGEVVLPPHGTVELLKWSGTELDVVNAARVSFAEESEELSAKDKGLLNFLLRERHGTPFEMGFNAHWHIRAPLFVFYEWHRHRIGMSYNEESARYLELRPDFYIPEDENIRTQVGKPGYYKYEKLTDVDYARASFHQVSNMAYSHYKDMIDRGVAKELARCVLPVNIYKEMRVVTNARSLMNFLSLRNSDNAMYEIRVYAEAMEKIFAQNMPTIHKAFVEHGRVAP